MTAKWYLIRHVPDLRRREPHNVGLVLQTPEGWLTKFVGQTDDGTIDGRHLPHKQISNTEVYKSWVSYYQRKASDHSWCDVATMQRRRTGNYVAEEGGELLDDPPSWQDALDRLFAELVATEVPNASPDRQEKPADVLLTRVQAVLEAARIVPERRVKVAARFAPNGHISEVPFRFKYVNGQAHLMDLGHEHVKPEQAAADARELRSRVEAARLAGSAQSFVTFYDSSLLDQDALEDVLLPLEEISYAVDVNSRPAAVRAMRELTEH
ncbi:hypothetical protein ACIRSS_50110 [Amycolatopsis sp. NPDC101161]|uniref:hypothetical protein n=1 Tax=Amycolatopsis sp. NPDC101161 TaxID=3363940 RepID=UPI003820796D